MVSGLTMGEVERIVRGDPDAKNGQKVDSVDLYQLWLDAEWERNRNRPWQE